MNNKTLFFLITTMLLVLNSCVDKATKFYTTGEQKYQNEEFDLAAHDLKQAVQYGASKKESYYLIAESYRRSNRLHEAEEFYLKAIEAGTKKENAHFYYALAMKSNGNYFGAKSQLKKYIEYGANYELLNRAKTELKSIDEIINIGFRKDFYKVYNFSEINTDAIEFSPMFYDEKTLYFTSSRGEGPIYPGQGTRFKDIYEYKFDGGSARSGIVRELPELINEPRRHEASATFSSNGKMMIFSRSGNGKKNDNIKEIDLFVSTLERGEWSEPVRLDISDEDAWDSSPFLSADDKTLYFSSNREGGLGADDIWYSTLSEDGSWSEPVNMGEPVNTPGEELFPYMRDNGDFYFSSDGHASFGELDIFKIVKNDDGKSVVVNPGKPLNSSYDDFAIIFENDLKGYFSSNRPGGKGDDDIYYFTYELDVKYYLEGVSQGKKIKRNRITNEVEILPFTSVQLLSKDGHYLASTVSDSVGFFKFEVAPEKEYVIRANKDLYITNKKNFSTIGKTLSAVEKEILSKDIIFKDSIALDPIVENMIIEFDPIYYPYNKWNITPRAAVVLDEMVSTLKDNPKILVELGSHTDARGSLKYNDILSQNRAQSAVDYIITHGIPSERLTAKGYGERVPKTLIRDTTYFKSGTVLGELFLDSLALKDTAASELGYQLNRRTEFKIVGFIKDALDPNNIKVEDNGETEKNRDEKLIKNEDAIIDKYLNKKEE